MPKSLPDQSKRDGFQMVGEHVEGCRAAQDEDGITFIVYDRPTFDRKRNGHRGGSTLWHSFRCNDTRCEARMLVRWDTLSAFVGGKSAR